MGIRTSMGKSFLHSNLDFFSTYLVLFSFLGDVQHYTSSACPVPSGDVSPPCVNSSASCSCTSSYTSAHLSRDTTAKVRSNLPIYRTLIRTYPLYVSRRNVIFVSVLLLKALGLARGYISRFVSVMFVEL